MTVAIRERYHVSHILDEGKNGQVQAQRYRMSRHTLDRYIFCCSYCQRMMTNCNAKCSMTIVEYALHCIIR